MASIFLTSRTRDLALVWESSVSWMVTVILTGVLVWMEPSKLEGICAGMSCLPVQVRQRMNQSALPSLRAILMNCPESVTVNPAAESAKGEKKSACTKLAAKDSRMKRMGLLGTMSLTEGGVECSPQSDANYAYRKDGRVGILTCTGRTNSCQCSGRCLGALSEASFPTFIPTSNQTIPGIGSANEQLIGGIQVTQGIAAKVVVFFFRPDRIGSSGWQAHYEIGSRWRTVWHASIWFYEHITAKF